MVQIITIVSWFIVSLIFRLNSKWSFFLVESFLIFSVFLLLVGYQGRGLRFTTYSFFFALIGLGFYLWEARRR